VSDSGTRMRLLCMCSESGPGPRSCHKMCFDSTNKCLYTLGRYVDPDSHLELPPSLSSLIERSGDATAALRLWSFLPSPSSIRQALATGINEEAVSSSSSSSSSSTTTSSSGAAASATASARGTSNGDFYCYDIPNKTWICLSKNTEVLSRVTKQCGTVLTTCSRVLWCKG
jgi:hypothetical protein